MDQNFRWSACREGPHRDSLDSLSLSAKCAPTSASLGGWTLKQAILAVVLLAFGVTAGAQEPPRPLVYAAEIDGQRVFVHFRTHGVAAAFGRGDAVGSVLVLGLAADEQVVENATRELADPLTGEPYDVIIGAGEKGVWNELVNRVAGQHFSKEKAEAAAQTIQRALREAAASFRPPVAESPILRARSVFAHSNGAVMAVAMLVTGGAETPDLHLLGPDKGFLGGSLEDARQWGKGNCASVTVHQHRADLVPRISQLEMGNLASILSGASVLALIRGNRPEHEIGDSHPIEEVLNFGVHSARHYHAHIAEDRGTPAAKAELRRRIGSAAYDALVHPEDQIQWVVRGGPGTSALPIPVRTESSIDAGAEFQSTDPGATPTLDGRFPPGTPERDFLDLFRATLHRSFHRQSDQRVLDAEVLDAESEYHQEEDAFLNRVIQDTARSPLAALMAAFQDLAEDGWHDSDVLDNDTHEGPDGCVDELGNPVPCFVPYNHEIAEFGAGYHPDIDRLEEEVNDRGVSSRRTVELTLETALQSEHVAAHAREGPGFTGTPDHDETLHRSIEQGSILQLHRQLEDASSDVLMHEFFDEWCGAAHGDFHGRFGNGPFGAEVNRLHESLHDDLDQAHGAFHDLIGASHTGPEHDCLDR